MPTRVNPNPGPGGAGTKAGSNLKPRLFDTVRFTAATNRFAKDFSDIAKERGNGSLSSTIFVAFVGLSFVGLGLYLVIHGDEDNILDLIVLGGLLIAMGGGTLVFGFVFVIVPIFKERRRRKVEASNEPEMATTTAASMPRKSVIAPAIAVPSASYFPGTADRAAAFPSSVPDSRTSSTSPAPEDTVLYDRESLNAAPDNDRRESKHDYEKNDAVKDEIVEEEWN